ncbi:MAG: TauD/TfdA family dioxygenase [Bacteroidota bacterium]
MIPASSPFHPASDGAYSVWRAAKLARSPARVDDLVVEVGDPRALTRAEHAAIAARLRDANLALYASPRVEADKDLPRKLGAQFGLHRLDRNWLADDDGVSSLAVADAPARGEYIPYTDKPINWHTDGYYNPPERQIRTLILHCVQRAEAGGENRLLDHEIAYILLRDAEPGHIRALAEPDAMTIPPRMDEAGVARAAEAGPVVSVDPETGALHMRYTARTRSIAWKDDAATAAAVRALEAILRGAAPYVFQVRLEPGMGLICNNVLHDRAGFSDSAARRRLVFRARYYDRIDPDDSRANRTGEELARV